MKFNIRNITYVSEDELSPSDNMKSVGMVMDFSCSIVFKEDADFTIMAYKVGGSGSLFTLFVRKGDKKYTIIPKDVGIQTLLSQLNFIYNTEAEKPVILLEDHGGLHDNETTLLYKNEKLIARDENGEEEITDLTLQDVYIMGTVVDDVLLCLERSKKEENG